jgi:hypothetical protein
MSAKSVYSIRIPVKFRKMMDQMDDVNWQEEMRNAAIELIKSKSRKRLLKDAQELRGQMISDVESAALIREDRNAR